ncbi:MAG: hypothetical protein K9M11_01725 [Candidatus Pacebacteria bacterium]|nr:hypothetical protein [Candidatus Paceibacterota bacterium]
MKKTIKLLILQVFTILTVLSAFISPVVVDAAGLVSFVPDECYGKPVQGANGQVTVACGWPQLMKMGQNILQNAIYLAAMAAVVSMVYAGYLYMTSGDDTGARKTANGIFGNVIKGIFFTMAAWLLVATMLKFLGVDNAYSLLR